MGSYTPGQLAIAVVVALGICALVYIAAGALGVPIPYWVVQLVVVCLVVCTVVAAIKFLMSLNS